MSAAIWGLSPAALKFCVAITRSPPNCLLRCRRRGLDRRREHGEQRDDGDADHQARTRSAAVRRGLRIAFSRASCPVMWRRRGSGAPSTDAAGRRHDRPEHDDADDREHRAETGRCRCHLRRPRPAMTSDDTADREQRHRARAGPATRRTASSATSRSAAIGGTRDARMAGNTVATQRDEHADQRRRQITVLALRVSAPVGTPNPSASNSRPQARGEPDAGEQTEDRRDESRSRAPRAAIDQSTCRARRRSPAAVPTRACAGRSGSRTCCRC